jgi:hypothetical protein
LVRGTYEEMVREGPTFFSRTMRALDLEYSETALLNALNEKIEGIRFNVGVVGRSVQQLSTANKAFLERMLLDYPQDLSELLRELPWQPRSRTARWFSKVRYRFS